MKGLLLFLLCSLSALCANAQASQPFHVDSVAMGERVADTFKLGFTCSYAQPGAKAGTFIFLQRTVDLSTSGKVKMETVALIRINGLDQWLQETRGEPHVAKHGVQYASFRNAAYQVALQLRERTEDGAQQGTMTVTDLKSKKRLKLAVEGSCEAP